MGSGCVRYLFFLVLLVVCAQAVELFALIELGDHSPADRRVTEQPTFDEIVVGIVFALGPCIGPPIVFAFAGLVFFRFFSWGLWSLAVCASIYALFILWGLLVEYAMARDAIATAAQGLRYMNCGGHPRLFFILFSVPLTAGTFLVSTAVVALEAIVHSLTAKPISSACGKC
jgi:hypothetical protein